MNWRISILFFIGKQYFTQLPGSSPTWAPDPSFARGFRPWLPSRMLPFLDPTILYGFFCLLHNKLKCCPLYCRGKSIEQFAFYIFLRTRIILFLNCSWKSVIFFGTFVKRRIGRLCTTGQYEILPIVPMHNLFLLSFYRFNFDLCFVTDECHKKFCFKILTLYVYRGNLSTTKTENFQLLKNMISHIVLIPLCHCIIAW